MANFGGQFWWQSLVVKSVAKAGGEGGCPNQVDVLGDEGGD